MSVTAILLRDWKNFFWTNALSFFPARTAKGSSLKNDCLAYATAPTPLTYTTAPRSLTHTTAPAPRQVHHSTYSAPRTPESLHRLYLHRLYDILSYVLARGGFGGGWRDAPLCGDRACRSAIAVAPHAFASSSANPLRGSYTSKRSRCGAVRIVNADGEPSAGIVRVEPLSL